ncbi:ankyrin repeat domain-containing protein 50 isoform X2 [Pieris rapae]|uniref:ankyrin repeat domain-containing protein 50 isoform X2 n=1 Tax=Pieris rapae TaxID=64459 RepID=UPI001E27AC77|nr:ankyrin repeat domain-containing protein 50 isoform X2 [Pieris rapae]
MSLAEFENWAPNAPIVMETSSHSVTLKWSPGDYRHLQNDLVYTVQRKEKMPPWVTVYSGGKTLKAIENLAPTQPHKFRLKIAFKRRAANNPKMNDQPTDNSQFDAREYTDPNKILQSLWSDETWANTASDGTTVACLCMAVRCGYGKQVQQMLDERPILLSAINAATGLTPLATAVIKGDTNMVGILLGRGADLEHRSSIGRTPLHLAVLAGHSLLVELLIDHGADIEARDINHLGVEHLAVDSGNLETLKFVLDRGDLNVTDNNGWTPLFRAICQGASTGVIEELVKRGSTLKVTDRAGLTLIAAARLLTDKHGKRRDSVLRMVDAQFHHEKVVASFTRVTKKISSVQALRTNK